MLFFAFSILASVVSSILANALSVAPTLFTMSCTLELKPSTPFDRSDIAAFPASELLNISDRARPDLLASSCIPPRISPSDLPLAINSAKLPPIFCRNSLSVVLPDFDNSFNILFMYVVVSAAAIPLLVIIAYPAHNCSSETLLAFAVGMILPILLASSPTVTLPLFCVCTSISDTVLTLSALMPYAFNTVVNTSSVCELSANPAFANFVLFVTKFTASPVFCPADIALYTSSAMALAAIPVLFDSSIICCDNVPSGTSCVSAMVPTFAIAFSYCCAACTGPAYTAAATALIAPIVPSSCPFVFEMLCSTCCCLSFSFCNVCCEVCSFS